MRLAAPGSLTREIARMLEIERQNREPADGSAGIQGPGGSGGSTGAGASAAATGFGTPDARARATETDSSGGGLLRRAGRAVPSPAGPPAESPPAASAASTDPSAASA